jgi:hypothetical protein
MWTSEDHAAWIINLQTGRLASCVSVVHQYRHLGKELDLYLAVCYNVYSLAYFLVKHGGCLRELEAMTYQTLYKIP